MLAALGVAEDAVDSDGRAAALAFDGDVPGASFKFDSFSSHGVSPCGALLYMYIQPWHSDPIKAIKCIYFNNLQMAVSRHGG